MRRGEVGLRGLIIGRVGEGEGKGWRWGWMWQRWCRTAVGCGCGWWTCGEIGGAAEGDGGGDEAAAVAVVEIGVVECQREGGGVGLDASGGRGRWGAGGQAWWSGCGVCSANLGRGRGRLAPFVGRCGISSRGGHVGDGLRRRRGGVCNIQEGELRLTSVESSRSGEAWWRGLSGQRWQGHRAGGMDGQGARAVERAVDPVARTADLVGSGKLDLTVRGGRMWRQSDWLAAWRSGERGGGR